jgi:two-component system, OmpR family, KDP operon response regulator KdpE
VTGGSKPLVLVVDDESAIRMLCRINLELDGYEVAEAASLAEARSVLESEPVSAVLLDLHLGGVVSSGLIADCAEHEPPIPVALLTGAAEDRVARSAGADAVLPKPFEVERLAETVRRLTSAAAG